MRTIEELLVADTLESLMTKLEAYSDYFEQLAVTAQQQDQAAEFKVLVEELFKTTTPSIERMEQAVSAAEKGVFQLLHGHDSLAGLFQEIRDDQAASKSEDAHWYGRDVFQKLLHERTETPAIEVGNLKEIER